MLAIEAMRESPPSSSAAAAEGAVLKHREPTPDHPPYSWMIGEAIAALGEGGGSAEDAISGFIRARHPGVPAAHDRFLRHYLAKHVAEGLFVCTAPGRYSCRAADDDDEPLLALEEGPSAEAKRVRGRPRKDASASDKKVGSESLSATPKRRGRPRKDGSPAALPPVAAASAASPAAEGKRGRGRPRKDGSSPAASKKDGSGSPSATPKRRGRSRVLPLTAVTDVSGKELVGDMKDGGDAPCTTDNNHGESGELALVVVNDGSTAPSVTEDDGGEAPSAKLPLMAKEPATFTTPERSTEPCKLALIATEEDSAPLLPLVATEPATFTRLECSTEPCKLVLVAADTDSAPRLDADKEEGTQAPFEGSALPLDTDKEDGTQAPFEDSAPPLVPDKEEGTQALFEGSTTELVADKEEGTQAPFKGSASALASDEDGAHTSFSTDKDNGTLTPFESSAPAPGADKDAFTEPTFTKHKRRRRTCKSAPLKATRPSGTPIAENKAAGKAVSAPPKGRGQECKPASAAAGELRPRRPAPKPQKMLLLNVDEVVPPKPRKMLLLNVDKVVPDNPMFCVLALPAPVPAATKA